MTKNRFSRVGIPAAAFVLLSIEANAQDFPQWRGANRDAHLTGFAAPAVWPRELMRRWKVAVGVGHSSPIIAGDSVYIFARQGENEIMRRLRRSDGKEIWREGYAAPYEMNPAAQGHGKGPKSTPVYAAGKIYALGISGVVSCYDAPTGKVVWRKNFASQFPATAPVFGTAMSPLVENNLLIVHLGGAGKGALTALETKTGRTRWQWTGDGPAYASPVVVTLGGVRQIVTQSQLQCIGIEAATGKLLWSVPFTTPYEQNSVTPLVVGDMIVFAGVQKPTFALRVRKNGAAWTAERAWENSDLPLYMSSPVVSGTRIYGMSAKRSGQLFSLDAATGKTLWTGEGRFGDNASVWDSGDYVLALNTGADLHVYRKAGDKLESVAQYTVADSPVWASPALSGNQILVKDENALTLWTLPERTETRKAAAQ